MADHAAGDADQLAAQPGQVGAGVAVAAIEAAEFVEPCREVDRECAPHIQAVFTRGSPEGRWRNAARCLASRIRSSISVRCRYQPPPPAPGRFKLTRAGTTVRGSLAYTEGVPVQYSDNGVPAPFLSSMSAPGHGWVTLSSQASTEPAHMKPLSVAIRVRDAPNASMSLALRSSPRPPIAMWGSRAQPRLCAYVLPASPTMLDRLRAQRYYRLSDTERSRCQRLHSESARRAFEIAHLLARHCSSIVSGRRAHQFIISQECDECGGPHGRPLVHLDPDGPDSFYVSWSHTTEHVFAAAASYPIAVDIEESHRRIPHDTIILNELELHAQLTASDLVRLWTRKECLVKLGLLTLDSFHTVDVRPDQVEVDGHSVLMQSLSTERWLASIATRDLPLGSPFAASGKCQT